MHPEVRDGVGERLQKVFAEIEATRGTLVGTSIRSFVTDLVVESLDVRREEWQRSYKLDPDSPGDVAEIAGVVETALRAIALDAGTYSSKAGAKHVLLIGVVEQAHRQFCKIFPFCR